MASGEMPEPALLLAGGVSADAVTAGSAAREAVHGAAKQAAASKCPVKRQASRGAFMDSSGLAQRGAGRHSFRGLDDVLDNS